jgi:hypothetical protein
MGTPAEPRPSILEPADVPSTPVSGYEQPRLLHYLNDPMGVGLWRMAFKFTRAPNQPTPDEEEEDSPARRGPAIEFFEWLLTKATVSGSSTDEEAKALRAKATLNLRRRMPYGAFYSRPSKRAGVGAQAGIAGLIGAGLAEARGTGEPDALVIEFKGRFPGLKLLEAENDPGFASTRVPQQFTLGGESPTELTALSLSEETLRRLAQIATDRAAASSALVETSLKKIYTPEETVFAPYLQLLLIYESKYRLSNDLRVRRDIRAAIDEAMHGRPEESIRDSGLAMELLLSEVYEQCFREKAPTKPLGGELKELASKAHSHMKRDRPDARRVTGHDHRRAVGEAITAQGDLHLKNGLIAVQHLLDHVEETATRVSSLERSYSDLTSRTHPLFPDQVFENLERAINLRNAAAHRTTTRITLFEAAVTARGLVNLITWWSRRDEFVTNWDTSIASVLDQLAARRSEPFFPT